MPSRILSASLARLKIFALPLLATVMLASAAKADDTAKEYVRGLGDEAIAILADESLANDEARDQFSELLLGAIDIKRIGLFALGQYARLPSDEQKEEYFDLLGEFVVEIYYGRLSGYSNETFEVTGATEKGDKGREVIVSSRIAFADTREPLNVQWWLIRYKDGSFRVFDVNVAGIWMAQEQRGTFASLIRNNGGQFEALLDHLRKQTADGEATTGTVEEAPDAAENAEAADEPAETEAEPAAAE